jgi:hypothetical protein
MARPLFQNKAAKLLSIVLLLACAGGPSDLNEFTSYFMPETATAQRGDNRYHYTQQFLYLDDYADSVKIDRQINAQAWAKYAGVSQATAYNYFYAETPNSTLINGLRKKGNKAAVAYLTLAKSIEKAYQPAIYAWEESSKDSVALVAAFEQVQALAQSTTDPFLKERYGFQAVKLAMILAQPETCLSLYEQLIKPLKTKTFISDWAAARQAGAAMALGDTAKAIYQFAQLFDRCPSRRREADLSLRIKGVRFQAKALDFCQNDAEKAAVYALCAIQPLEDGLPMLQKIVELNPKNGLLELIAAREINKNEFYGFDQTYYVEDSASYQNRRNESGNYFAQLGDFAVACADNKNLENRAFWWTAASYVQYVQKNYDQASNYLTKAQAASTQNPGLKQQIEVQQMLILIAKQDKITPEFESQAVAMLEKTATADNFRVTNAYTRACGLLAKMYRGQPKETAAASGGLLSGCSKPQTEISNEINLAKAFLLQAAASWQSKSADADGYTPIAATNTDRYAVEDSSLATEIVQVIKYLQQENLTETDKKIIKLSGVDASYLNVVLGRKYLLEHQYAQAAAAFGQVKPEMWKESAFSDNLTANPFYLKPNNGQNPNERFTPASFAQRMVALEKRAQSGDAEAAYLLGCGAYNMGYFGNSWVLSQRQRSSSEYEYMYPVRDLSTNDYYTAAKAQTYFEKAAQNAKNADLAAKATFGASLCAKNAFYLFRATEGRDLGYEEDVQAQFKARMSAEQRKRLSPYFDALKTKYASTAYAQEVINECATYRVYVGE